MTTVLGEQRLSPLDNVLGQLRADHVEIQGLFGLYAEESSPVVRMHLLPRLCRALRLHCALEAGVFITAVAHATGNIALLEQTGVEYARLTELICAIAGTDGETERLTRLIQSLQRFVDQHIAAADTDDGVLVTAYDLHLDWEPIERSMRERREELSRLFGLRPSIP